MISNKKWIVAKYFRSKILHENAKVREMVFKQLITIFDMYEEENVEDIRRF